MAETRTRLGNSPNSAAMVKTTATGSGAIAATFTAIKACRLTSVTCKLDAVPATSENFTVTLDAKAGAAYDVLLYSIDPSAAAATSATNIVLTSEHWGEIWLQTGDAVTVAYANTDTATYGVEITVIEGA